MSSIFNYNKSAYVYKGKKNKTTHKAFIRICKAPAAQLKLILEQLLKGYYPEIINEDGFLYAKGNDILLTAHMDTVHAECVKDFYELSEKGRTVISSPQGIGGDDRCGIYMIMNILYTTNFRPSILFCEDEEIGGVGSEKFCKTKYIEDIKELKYIIELDRANANDAVFYNCGNEKFQEFILETTGYKKTTGSFSDISHLSPATDVASVNLSCGYYHAHTTQEEVVYEEMEHTIEVVKKLLEMASESPAFDYQEDKYSYNDWFYDYYRPSQLKGDLCGVSIEYFEEDKRDYDYIEGDSYEECMGLFFLSHPFVCLDDVIDIEEMYEDDYYYYGYESERNVNISAN